MIVNKPQAKSVSLYNRGEEVTVAKAISLIKGGLPVANDASFKWANYMKNYGGSKGYLFEPRTTLHEEISLLPEMKNKRFPDNSIYVQPLTSVFLATPKPGTQFGETIIWKDEYGSIGLVVDKLFAEQANKLIKEFNSISIAMALTKDNFEIVSYKGNDILIKFKEDYLTEARILNHPVQYHGDVVFSNFGSANELTLGVPAHSVWLLKGGKFEKVEIGESHSRFFISQPENQSMNPHHEWVSAHDSASLMLSYVEVLAEEPQLCLSPTRSTADEHVLPLIDKAVEANIQRMFLPVEVRRKSLSPVLEFAGAE
ncbi:MAG: hypothetical protein NTX79_03250 [Candidatus Micrarchaeota archaeon]|nr:hypothetical protein [Candidatus Micrarchaeota archaeon]